MTRDGIAQNAVARRINALKGKMQNRMYSHGFSECVSESCDYGGACATLQNVRGILSRILVDHVGCGGPGQAFRGRNFHPLKWQDGSQVQVETAQLGGNSEQLESCSRERSADPIRKMGHWLDLFLRNINELN